jgi:hypothetical protein
MPNAVASPLMTDLRHRLARLSTTAGPRTALPFGIKAIDRVLPGGSLALGAVHEICELRRTVRVHPSPLSRRRLSIVFKYRKPNDTAFFLQPSVNARASAPDARCYSSKKPGCLLTKECNSRDTRSRWLAISLRA